MTIYTDLIKSVFNDNNSSFQNFGQIWFIVFNHILKTDSETGFMEH